jgi:predicted helicase
MGTLEPIKKAITDALGVRFEGEKGVHFFQSTLVQTLFYGIFSAWVLWHESHPKPKDRFQWRLSAQHLGLPILRTLFVQLAGDPKKVRALNLEEVLDWTEDCLSRVDRTSFFARYDMGEAVQYFYEPFLAEFDPELRKDFGVWYTPPEIVRYMVGSVDQALRENFGLADGLADPSVIVLDPCCGTGAYLVETLRLIRQRLVEGYGETQAALKIREVAKKRLYGFELLPAPYVVSHLQIDLLLTRWGATLDHENDERAGVYLTNALTGWVPVKHPKDQVLFPKFSDERDAADHVKQQEQILVILGNPPYDGYAGLAVEEERNLSEAYRSTKEAPAPQGQGLNDLYVRFFRMAERRIAEGVPQADGTKAGPPRADAKGIVCFISNYRWLDGLSHPGMRERFMEVFDQIIIDNLHGDRIISEYAPDGGSSETVFAMGGSSSGIKIGTAIATLIRRPTEEEKAPVEIAYRDWHQAKAEDRRSELLKALDEPDRLKKYQRLDPPVFLGVPFKPLGYQPKYPQSPKVTDLLLQSFSGVKTARDQDLVSIDLESLKKRMEHYFDAAVSHSAMRREAPEIMGSDARFKADQVRDLLRKRGMKPDSFIRYCYRPFDVRWLFWEGETMLLDRARTEFRPHIFGGNLGLVLAQKTRKGFEPPVVSRAITSYHVIESVSLFFPLFLAQQGTEADDAHPDLFASSKPTGPQPNLTDFATTYLAGLKCGPEDLFFHLVAVLHAPAYREENGGALRQDWPRIPLPKDAKTLRAGADLGRQLAALLDPETPVPGVTDLKPRADLKGLGELAIQKDAAKQPDLTIAARWGYAGQGGVTMPGPGKITSGTRGEGFVDIHLNATTRWKDVPAPVWSYTLGGYQVLKKWLSYREHALLGRALTGDEAQSFTHHVRRIASILSLHPELDAHYRASI